ncbi:MAG: hypothetical protein WCV83_02255 [Candidatus Magasanikbacteria bacterium]|jgi:hypothetical protein
MKISAQLHQFINESALLVVSGTQAANFYIASEGEIAQAGQVTLLKSHYSDRENFGRRGSLVFESGSKIEKMKRSKHSDFLVLVKDFVKQISGEQKFSAVYLFAPTEIMLDIKKTLPAVLVKKIKCVYLGNLHKEKPMDILKKLKKKPLK